VNELEKKNILATRITAHLNLVPANCVWELLQQSLADLSLILGRLATTRDQEQVDEATLAHAEEARKASQFDGAWVGALRNVSLNGKRLCDAESNRAMLESLLQAHEMPSGSLYGTILLSYPTKFSWEVPRPKQTDADRQAEFARICRENSLSECVANQQLHKNGAALDSWAGASGLERAAFQAQAAQARQTFLIKHTTPQQLKQESAYESQVNRDVAQRAEADRQYQFVSQQQGLYSPLPTHNANGEEMNSRYLRRLSTVDFAAFKIAAKK
jgi:hypothetical protein